MSRQHNTPQETLSQARALLAYQESRPGLHADAAATRRLIARAEAQVAGAACSLGCGCTPVAAYGGWCCATGLAES